MASSQDLDFVFPVRQTQHISPPAAREVFAKAGKTSAVSTNRDARSKREVSDKERPITTIPSLTSSPIIASPLDRGRAMNRPGSFIDPVTVTQVSGLPQPPLDMSKQRSMSTPNPIRRIPVPEISTGVPTSPAEHGTRASVIKAGDISFPFINHSGTKVLEARNLAEIIHLPNETPTQDLNEVATCVSPDQHPTGRQDMSFELVDGVEIAEHHLAAAGASQGAGRPVGFMGIPLIKRRSRFGSPPLAKSTFASPGNSPDPGTLMGLGLGIPTSASDPLSHQIPMNQRRVRADEAKDNKRLTRVIVEEGKADRKRLNGVLAELDDLVRVHKQTIKQESKALNAHNKVLRGFTKDQMSFEVIKRQFLQLESAYKSSSIELEQAQASLAEHRERAAHALECIKAKREEVEELREVYGVDERERLLHLDELKEVSDGNRQTKGSPQLLSGKGRFSILR